MVDLTAGPPPIPQALVEWLEQVYPDRFPTIPEDAPIATELVARAAGRLDVVRLLRTHLTRQSQPPTPKRR